MGKGARGLAMACGWLVAALFLGSTPVQAREAPTRALPRFTEEREAAALFFVKKHLKELLPVLEQLKKSQPAHYEREIREIFQVTEWLADLKGDMTRHDLELNIWVKETRAFLLIAKLATPNAEERKRIDGQLQELARELVELDVQVLNNKVTNLKLDLSETEDELNRLIQNREKQTTERYQGLLKKLRQGNP